MLAKPVAVVRAFPDFYFFISQQKTPVRGSFCISDTKISALKRGARRFGEKFLEIKISHKTPRFKASSRMTKISVSSIGIAFLRLVAHIFCVLPYVHHE